MLNIFIMTVQFHADRWDGCAVHAMSHSPPTVPVPPGAVLKTGHFKFGPFGPQGA